MRADELYLRDITRAADDLAALMVGLTLEAFASAMPTRRATLQALTEIGEACARLSADCKSRHPEVPWQDAIAMRNFAVHAYFGIDWRIVYETATDDVPSLKAQIESILSQECPAP